MDFSEERRIVVERSARYYVDGTPGSHIEKVWMLCHGYGQLAADFLKQCRGLAGEKTLLVAPEGLSRFYLRSGSGTIGASWMTREDRLAEIDDYLRFLDAIWDAVRADCGSEPQVSVLGFSQGGATAARWGMRGAANVDRTVLWGASIPKSEVEEYADRLRQIGLILVRGERDPLVNRSEFEESLETFHRFGIPVALLTHTGAHELDENLLHSLAEL